MGQALYRKYRSKKLSELVGQEHITAAIGRSLKKGTVSHAYLFTGPRGVGKTSIARILAHEINGLPYEDDATHLDIIEIDAASNRRIDEIRDLRDKVHIAPTSAKYKVYIIDEVHMLTKEAFNALLKTLEEPPAHVIFMLATTEVHKLPETIISRTQRFAFKPVELSKVVDHLAYIAKQEHITIDHEALKLIAAHGDGSFRDSISLLDQVQNSGEKVTLAMVQAVLGIAPAKLIEDLQTALATHDTVAVAQHIQTLQAQGYEPAQVARQLGQTLRDALTHGKLAIPHEVAVQLLSRLVEVPASSDPRTYLEISLLDAALSGKPPVDKAAAPTPKAAAKVMHEEVQVKSVVQVEPHPSSFHKATKDETATPVIVDASVLLDDGIWQQVLHSMKQTHNTLYGIIRTAQPVFTPGQVTLSCDYAFHKKRLSETRNREVVAKIIQEVTGQSVRIDCVQSEGNATPAPPMPPSNEQVHTVQPPKPSENPAVASVSNIFGGAELLES